MLMAPVLCLFPKEMTNHKNTTKSHDGDIQNGGDTDDIQNGGDEERYIGTPSATSTSCVATIQTACEAVTGNYFHMALYS